MTSHYIVVNKQSLGVWNVTFDDKCIMIDIDFNVEYINCQEQVWSVA